MQPLSRRSQGMIHEPVLGCAYSLLSSTFLKTMHSSAENSTHGYLSPGPLSTQWKASGCGFSGHYVQNYQLTNDKVKEQR